MGDKKMENPFFELNDHGQEGRTKPAAFKRVGVLSRDR
jgi:hypothetical protein